MTTLDTASPMRRFTFTSFDAKEEEKPVITPEVKAAEPALPAGPILLPLQLPAITEKDLLAARAEAQAAGYREGYAAAQTKAAKESATREDAVKSLLEIIANRITIAAEAQANVMKEREDLMGRLVMAVSRKVAGDALKREPYAGVESLLRECMALIAGEKSVRIVVSSTLAPGLKQRIDTLTPMLREFEGKLVVEEDPHLLDQDCRVEWADGYSERRLEDLWSALEAIVIKTNVN